MDSKDLFRALGDLEEELVRQAETPRRGRRWPKALAACACAALILAGAWLYGGRQKGADPAQTRPAAAGDTEAPGRPSGNEASAAPAESALRLTLTAGTGTLTAQEEQTGVEVRAFGQSWDLPRDGLDGLWTLLETLPEAYVPGDVPEQTADLTLALERGGETRRLTCAGAAVLLSEEPAARDLRAWLEGALAPYFADRAAREQLDFREARLSLSWESVGGCSVDLATGAAEFIPARGEPRQWTLGRQALETLAGRIAAMTWTAGAAGSLELTAGGTAYTCPAPLDGLGLALLLRDTLPDA